MDIRTPERQVYDIRDAIGARRSVRRYAPEAIPPEQVDRLLSAAVRAPSAHNRQPWRFRVVADGPEKARLAAAMGARLRSDRLADGDDPAEVDRDVARSHARITGAPVVVALCLAMADMDVYPDPARQAAERTMAVQSVAMAGQNLLLAAEAEGLGACWMCAPLFCPELVAAALALPAGWEAQGLITIGRPAGPARRRPRRPLSEVIARQGDAR